MKHAFTLFFLITLLGILPIEIVAQNSSYSYTVTLHRLPTHNNDENNNGGKKWPDGPNGDRKPSRPIECYISKDSGIMIYGASDEIVSYEIWDMDGNCCLSLSHDELDFLNDLFSFSGDFQIRFNSADYTYIGILLALNSVNE